MPRLHNVGLGRPTVVIMWATCYNPSDCRLELINLHRHRAKVTPPPQRPDQSVSLPHWTTNLSTIRIGTRGSKLALWQAEWVAAQLTQRGHDVELIVITTQGDSSSQSLKQVGGQGVFTKEIQNELLAERVDVAVHSLKDLPTLPVDDLHLAAIPARETTDDCLISREGVDFESLPAQSRVGTGSSRRGAQLLHWRSDIQVADIRGNVDSRLRKLEEGQFDAIVLAAAGLTRLKLLDVITQRLPVDRMLPAIGQGALGLECRVTDHTTTGALVALNDPRTAAAVTAERALLRALDAGCLAPVAGIGVVTEDKICLTARVLSVDGSDCLDAAREDDLSTSLTRENAVGASVGGDGQSEDHPAAPLDERIAQVMRQAEKIGKQLANDLLEKGAADLIETARRN